MENPDDNLEIDGVLYDQRLTRGILRLVNKYQISKKEAAAVISFFNNMFVPDYELMADKVCHTAKKWKQSPVYMINRSLEISLIFCNKN